MKTVKLSTIALVLASILGCATSGPAVAKDSVEKNQLEQVKRDINIMSNILSTSLKDSIGRNAGDVSGRYLANQGLMFEVSTQNRFFSGPVFQDPNGFARAVLAKEHVGPIGELPPPPPLPPGKHKRIVVVEEDGEVITDTIVGEEVDELEERIEEVMEFKIATAGTERVIEWSGDGINEFEMLIDTNEIIDHAMPNANTAEQKALRKRHMELRKKQRELERKASKIERKTRQIERQMRDAELANELGGKEQQDKMRALESEMAVMSKDLTKINKELAEHRELVAEQVEKAKAKAREQQQKLAKQYANTISEVVCDFAGGLRSLKSDQYMTFFVNDTSKRYYVFSNKDIEKCQSGKINHKELLSKATTYSL